MAPFVKRIPSPAATEAQDARSQVESASNAFPFGPGDPKEGRGQPPPAIPAAPPPPPPPPGGGRARGTSGAAAGSSATPRADPSDPFNQDFWKALHDEYKNQLLDLEHNWQVDGGFSIDVSHAQLVAMAQQHVASLLDFGQWMWGNAMSDPQKSSTPWLGFGMDKDTYRSATQSFAAEWKSLTGQDFDATFGGANWGMLQGALSKGQTPSEFQTSVLSNQKILDTYGWLKYGYNFAQFQQYKLGQRQYVGGDMSDDQALKQLQYRHTAAGPALEATAKPPAGTQQQTQELEGSIQR